MRSTRYSTPADDAGLGDALDALAVGVHQVGVRLVVGVEVLVVEARALAQLAVPGLELLGRVPIVDDGVDPGRISSIFSKSSPRTPPSSSRA